MENKKKIVVALGGNALGSTAEEQLKLVKETARTIVDLVQAGHKIVVGHGNGPQVGVINLAMEVSFCSDVATPYMPFPECGAMSQGYIGYHLQQAIKNELCFKRIEKNVVSLITQTVVDKNDPAFKHPTKPVGMFYTKEKSEEIGKEKGYVFVEDSGRGYRRVVPSPEPKKIVEFPIIDELVKKGDIVIAAGGGGIPVIETENGLEGVSAVIDKDKSCAKLASFLGVDVLLILTAVDAVYANYKKENEQKLKMINESEALAYCKEGQFAKGSMLPKIEACLEFLKSNPKGKAIVSSLSKAEKAISGKEGTIIYSRKGEDDF